MKKLVARRCEVEVRLQILMEDGGEIIGGVGLVEGDECLVGSSSIVSI